MTPGYSWAHPLFHFWEWVSPFYLGDRDALCFICESLIFRIKSKTSEGYQDNLQDKLLVPLFFFFFFPVASDQHWKALASRPTGMADLRFCPWDHLGSPFNLPNTCVSWGAGQERVDGISLRGNTSPLTEANQRLKQIEKPCVYSGTRGLYSLCGNQSITRLGDGSKEILVEPKSLLGNASHNIPRTSKTSACLSDFTSSGEWPWQEVIQDSAGLLVIM